jgi:hypothetical protein
VTQTMEVLELLDALNDEEIRAVMARSNDLLEKRDLERKAKALTEAKALLKGAGIKNLGIRRKAKREGK